MPDPTPLLTYWRSHERPKAGWSTYGPRCKACGRSNRAHRAHGLCRVCYDRDAYYADREAVRARKRRAYRRRTHRENLSVLAEAGFTVAGPQAEDFELVRDFRRLLRQGRLARLRAALLSTNPEDTKTCARP